ncbi:MAG: X-Pro aminopeptidase [Rhodospirillaceae bacterium]|jgi:Xaa-Pro aminopeptidase|nr:X-Pro aminopeptidase [Rhodospirillaceae bacterium]
MALNGNKSGDETLERLLSEAGSALDAAGVRDLVQGVIAAPPGVEAEAWMSLVVPEPGGELKQSLAALKTEIQTAADDGLDGGPTDPARLDALRKELQRRDLDGFILPRSDEHQGEYVARKSERLAWLTGFTGSAGMTVVLADRAAVFVDSRYTLQAEKEIDGGLFEHCHLIDRPPADWIAANLAPGARLGYDPWLLTPVQAARYQAACKKAGAELAASDGNPVDAVWTGQPAAPISPVVAHDGAFAGDPSADKRRRIADGLKADKAGAAVLTAPDSIAWLLNVRGGDVPFTPLALSFAVLYADASAELFMDGRKLAPGTPYHLGPDVEVLEPDAFGPALDKLGKDGKTVRVSADTAPRWVFDRLQKAGAVVDRGDDPCQLPKAIKTAAQMDGIRAAHRRDGASLTRFLAWLGGEAANGSLTETACADKLESLRRGNDHFQGLSFPTISGAGANGAVVHYRVSGETDAPLRPKSLYLVDSGAQYLDGTTDVTRTIAIGGPTDEMRRNFTLVLKGHIALATARFPEGTTGSQLDTLARVALWRVGLDYDHGTGHGVGHFLGVHEGPHRISKRSNRVALAPGMVVSNEPGYYKAGAYGIRIENLVTVVQVEGDAEKQLLGFETLTLAPIDRALVVADMLDGAEAAWLDAYHARVLDEITPLVDEATAEWLAEAAAPIA